MTRLILTLFTILGFFTAPLAAAPTPADDDGRVAAEASWATKPAAGETAEILLRLSIDESWHIQAGKGSGDEQPNYIETTVSLSGARGWHRGKIVWPESHPFTIGDGPYAETVVGYEGDIEVRVPVRVPSDAAPGEHKLTLTVGYQACDDRVCEAPTDTRTVIVANLAAPVDAAPPAGLDFPGTDFGAATPAAGSNTSRISTEVALYEGMLPAGGSGNVGVIFEIDEHWHVQAGKETGLVEDGFIATSVELDLPDGWTTGSTLWPEAKDFTFGTGAEALTMKGYEGRFAVVVPVTAPDSIAPGEFSVTARIVYQACDDETCDQPVDAIATGELAVRLAEAPMDRMIDDELSELIESTLQSTQTTATKSGPSFDLSDARWWLAYAFFAGALIWMLVRTFRLSRRNFTRLAVSVVALSGVWLGFTFVKGLVADPDFWVKYSEEKFAAAMADGDKTVLIKFTADWCAICQVNERIIIADDEAFALLSGPDVVAFKVDYTSPSPDGDLRKDALGGGGIPLIGVYRPDADPVPIRGQLPSARPVIDALQGRGGGLVEGEKIFRFLGWTFNVSEDATLIILALAFVAGFLMNFTPCVLPVVPIKILSLQAHAKDPARCFFLGLVFGLGIVFLYVILGVLMAGLVSGIDKMNWGDQFQLWWLNGILGLFVGVMGFGMLGLFAIRLPQFLYMFSPQSDTVTGSFFMGVFTAVLSTPCTGPLLGATVAWVVTQPNYIAFLTLLIMGLGMAFPYVLLTARPEWLERLPRTGPGSELVKQVMGLLLIAVAVYFLGTAIVSLQKSMAAAPTAVVATSSP